MGKLQETAVQLVEAIQTRSYDQIGTFFADEFIYKAHPGRLFGRSDNAEGLTATQFVDSVRNLSFITRWDFDTEHPLNVVEGDRSIAIHFSATPTHISGQKFSSEYVYFLKFDAEGKITQFDEFFDTKYLTDISAAPVAA